MGAADRGFGSWGGASDQLLRRPTVVTRSGCGSQTRYVPATVRVIS